jgi:hypothetical protein
VLKTCAYHNLLQNRAKIFKEYTRQRAKHCNEQHLPTAFSRLLFRSFLLKSMLLDSLQTALCLCESVAS